MGAHGRGGRGGAGGRTAFVTQVRAVVWKEGMLIRRNVGEYFISEVVQLVIQFGILVGLSTLVATQVWPSRADFPAERLPDPADRLEAECYARYPAPAGARPEDFVPCHLGLVDRAAGAEALPAGECTPRLRALRDALPLCSAWAWMGHQACRCLPASALDRASSIRAERLAGAVEFHAPAGAPDAGAAFDFAAPVGYTVHFNGSAAAVLASNAPEVAFASPAKGPMVEPDGRGELPLEGRLLDSFVPLQHALEETLVGMAVGGNVTIQNQVKLFPQPAWSMKELGAVMGLPCWLCIVYSAVLAAVASRVVAERQQGLKQG